MNNLEALSLKVKNDELFILDQQLLPDEELWVKVESPNHMIDIIKKLKVRGAPLIGVAASMALALWCKEDTSFEDYQNTAEALRASRPTAVNLMNALDRMLEVGQQSQMSLVTIQSLAEKIFNEDVELCLKMARVGEDLIQDGDSILTHCNTGGLATVGIGTALGLITHAHSQGKKIHV